MNRTAHVSGSNLKGHKIIGKPLKASEPSNPTGRSASMQTVKQINAAFEKAREEQRAAKSA